MQETWLASWREQFLQESDGLCGSDASIIQVSAHTSHIDCLAEASSPTFYRGPTPIVSLLHLIYHSQRLLPVVTAGQTQEDCTALALSFDEIFDDAMYSEVRQMPATREGTCMLVTFSRILVTDCTVLAAASAVIPAKVLVAGLSCSQNRKYQ